MKKFLLSLLVLCLGLAGSYWLLSAEQALVSAQAPLSQDVAQAKQAILRNYQQLQGVGAAEFSFTAAEFQALALVGSHSQPWLRFKLLPSEGRLRMQGSLLFSERLPRPYVNFVLELQQPLQLTRLQLGNVRLSGQWMQRGLLVLADFWHPEWNTSTWLGLMQQLPQQYSAKGLSLQMDAQTKAQLTEHLKVQSRDRWDVSQQQAITHYYQQLQLHRLLLAEQDNHSLLRYLRPLAQDVLQRSKTEDLEHEAQAMAWALFIFFSDEPLRTLVAKELSSELSLEAPPFNVSLAGRHDLHLHFIYSAALSMAAKPYLSQAAGEYKELFDSRAGGSGFSFVDLAADMTGLRFAQAFSSRAQTQHLLQILSQAEDERSFFPGVSDLPEGYSEREFTHLYQDIASPAYLLMLDHITDSIDALAAY